MQNQNHTEAMKHPRIVMKHIVIDRLIIYQSAQSFILIRFQHQQFLEGFVTEPIATRSSDKSCTAEQSFNAADDVSSVLYLTKTAWTAWYASKLDSALLPSDR